MKISRAWLQNFFDVPLPDAQMLADALTFHAFEIEDVETRGDDDILDVKVTPNRGHDCLSHRGIAKELSAILRIPFKPNTDPFDRPIELSKKTDAVTVSIEEPALCRRYIAGYITGVKIGPSPDWLRASLESIGQRSINNIVDATNLVMFNIGQPLHAFDAKRLGSLVIGVRKARAGETMEALDEKTYSLHESMLIITAADRPVGIAGVKGGMADRIDEGTTEVLLEAANFDGPTTRKTAAALKLRTDASSRFEQELSPELAAVGMQQVVDLIATVAGGTVEGFVDVFPTPRANAAVTVSQSKIDAVLGTSFSKEESVNALDRLGLSVTKSGDSYSVSAPHERLDITIAEDVVEEVGRIVGYDKIPTSELPPFTAASAHEAYLRVESIREDLLQKGYSEVYTSVFAEKGDRAVLNKVGGERPYLRTTLLDGLRDALDKNVRIKDVLGEQRVRLFEIGTIWKKDAEAVMVATVGEKEEPMEQSVEAYAASSHATFPSSPTERYKAFSRYPFIVRDIAMWVPTATDPEAILKLIREKAGQLLVRVALFDTFQKGERTSLAFRLVFQSFEKTLTDDEANDAMTAIRSALEGQGFEIR